MNWLNLPRNQTNYDLDLSFHSKIWTSNSIVLLQIFVVDKYLCLNSDLVFEVQWCDLVFETPPNRSLVWPHHTWSDEPWCLHTICNSSHLVQNDSFLVGSLSLSLLNIFAAELSKQQICFYMINQRYPWLIFSQVLSLNWLRNHNRNNSASWPK